MGAAAQRLSLSGLSVGYPVRSCNQIGYGCPETAFMREPVSSEISDLRNVSLHAYLWLGLRVWCLGRLRV